MKNVYSFKKERNRNWPGGRKNAPKTRYIVGGESLDSSPINKDAIEPDTIIPDALSSNPSVAVPDPSIEGQDSSLAESSEPRLVL